MISLLVTLYIWAMIALAFGTAFTCIAYRYYKKGREYAHAQEEIVKKTEAQTRKEYNKIATLPMNELINYLTITFARELILVSEQDVSERQRDAHETLYAGALGGLMDYLGEDTLAAIEFYYGKGFIDRWCRKAYLALEHESVASSIINKERNIESIAHRIAAWQ